MDNNNQQLIYDLPTRFFHWIFAFLFSLSFIITKLADEHSLLFTYHMLFGLILGSLVVLRLFWGFLGTKYARFSSFMLRPTDLIDYFKNIFSSTNEKKWAGHNPASSWAALIMLVSVLGLSISGILIVTGNRGAIKELHEFFANLFLITSILHIAGVLLHSFKHRDNIALSMIHGKKQINDNKLKISNSRVVTAIILLIFITFVSSYILIQYDSSTQNLNIFGKNLILGKGASSYKKDVDKEINKEESYTSKNY